MIALGGRCDAVAGEFVPVGVDAGAGITSKHSEDKQRREMQSINSSLLVNLGSIRGRYIGCHLGSLGVEMRGQLIRGRLSVRAPTDPSVVGEAEPWFTEYC